MVRLEIRLTTILVAFRALSPSPGSPTLTHTLTRARALDYPLSQLLRARQLMHNDYVEPREPHIIVCVCVCLERGYVIGDSSLLC